MLGIVLPLHLTTKDKRDRFSQRELANIFYGHALLCWQLPEDFKKAWYSAAHNHRLKNKIKEPFDELAFTNIFYGHALLKEQVPEGLILPVVNILEQSDDLKIQTSIYRGLSYYGLNHCLDPNLTEILINKSKKKTSKISAFQSSVGFILNNIFPQEFQAEAWFDSLLSCVDFFSQDRNIVIEADGPSHFLGKTKKYNLKTLLRNAILEKSEKHYMVVCIPYYEWEIWENDEERALYLKNKIGGIHEPIEETTCNEISNKIVVPSSQLPSPRDLELNPSSKVTFS